MGAHMKCKRLQLFLFFLLLGVTAHAAWERGTHFRIGYIKGRPCLIAPDGEPFKSVGMVWAYGPETDSGPLTGEELTEHLQLIKDLGFNTLNLYGDKLIPEMLDWCDEHEMGVYFRTAYYPLSNFPSDLREYPDYMDPGFREEAKKTYRVFLDQIKGHPSVLAIDMDHRWLFPLDWSGEKRFAIPKIRPHGVKYFPKWLGERYGNIDKLNKAWGTDYSSFEHIIEDPALLKDGEFRKLKNHPARVDIVLYTLWTGADFLNELAVYLKSQAPGVLVTPTTEHPECIPETNPGPDKGISFMSPVHYNGEADFIRDLPGLCKLIYETRWHYDMQGGPPYVSETGFRTSTLKQHPPVKSYAWLIPPNEETAARAYAEQFSLMSVIPWISGFGYFKLYDKIPEGDFGYLRDDGTKKPMAYVGDAINGVFDVEAVSNPDPEIWIYYPNYAQASHRPGFQQIKTLMAVLEKPFLDAFDRQLDKYWKSIREGNRKVGQKFARAVSRDFNKLWYGFAFTQRLPEDDKPIVLLSTISELLSPKDRAELLKKKTITFGPVGIRDVIMREVDPWYLESLRLTPSRVSESYQRLKLEDGSLTPIEAHEKVSVTNSIWSFVNPSMFEKNAACTGQGVDIPPARYTRMELLLGSEEGNAAPLCDLVYTDGTWEQHPLGPTICDMKYKPVMTGSLKLGSNYLSVIRVPLMASKELGRVEMPNAPWVKIYGIILVSGGLVEHVDVAVKTPGGRMSGETIWWAVLPERKVDGLHVLERFESGEPAVVAAGSHVSYLYDPLNWSTGTNEISRHTALIKKSLDGAIKYLEGVKIDD